MMSIPTMPQDLPQATPQNDNYPNAGQPPAQPIRSEIGFRLGRFQGEATLDDLMSDPVMPVLWQADHLKEGDVRRLLREVADRLRQRPHRQTCLGAG